MMYGTVPKTFKGTNASLLEMPGAELYIYIVLMQIKLTNYIALNFICINTYKTH